MPVYTGAIIATTSANVAASSAAEHRAEIASCKAIDFNYNPNGATVTEKRQYAECINKLYPMPATETDIALMKVAFVIGLIGMAIGFMIVWRDDKDPVVLFFMSIIGFFALPAIAAFLALIVCGIGWLFS